MKKRQKYKVNREGWPAGPWDGEPDRMNFVDDETDSFCLIVRNSLGNLCGYVAVERDHPWHGKGYDDIEDVDGVHPECHGGLTYAADNHKLIGFVGGDGLWWVGFDCAHSGDLVPAMMKLRKEIPLLEGVGDALGETYKGFKYVREGIESLARQAKEVRDAKQSD